MTKDFSIALFPLDNRPVSYLLPKQIADFSGVNLILPEKKYLGNLNKGSDLDCLEKWLINLGLNSDMSLVISLDNWIYGGLIQSRKHNYTMDELRGRANLLRSILKKSHKSRSYAFSTILRISNSNINEEEKEYWKDYGEKIFKWSELMYKVGRGTKEEKVTHEELIESWYQSSKQIPSHILSDYKSHRDKNLTINMFWLESLHEKLFEYLIFSSDDSSTYGMNVVEAEYLKKQIKNHSFSNLATVISGTDEIPLVLFTKEILNKYKAKPTISVYFNSVKGKEEFARYESGTIYNSVLDQIRTFGLEVKNFKDSDIAVFIHMADSYQGDHIFKKDPETSTKGNVNKIISLVKEINKPFILLDLAYANGADPNLIETLFVDENKDIIHRHLYGFAAWNTCSNSTGSALAMGVNRWLAEERNTFNEKEFKKCLLTRLLDDYAYQAKVRHFNIKEEEINEKMKDYSYTFSRLLGLNDINVKCLLPWNRSFEVEIDLPSQGALATKDNV